MTAYSSRPAGSSGSGASATVRRPLRFSTLADLLAELDRLEAADQAGRLRAAGRWTFGQILAHLAAWIEYGYEGFPMRRAPWLVRQFLRLRLAKFLRDGLPAGVRIPGVKDGATGADAISTAAGLQRYRAALRRLTKEPARYDSPAFGRLSEAQRIALNLRHAELHLSCLHPE